MIYKLQLTADAINDMTEAFDWYEARNYGLGKLFLNEVEKYLDLIIGNPKSFRALGNQRVAIMQRYPFKIAYEIKFDLIVVYAVYHHSRNPTSLKKRSR